MARSQKNILNDRIEYHPVTQACLGDVKRFAKKYGKFGYCACMRWRLRSTDFQRTTKEERNAHLEQLVQDNVPVGILALDADEPVGWCSVAPRETYHALQASRVLPSLDDKHVWSVVCFFVAPQYRSKGLSVGLLQAAVHYAIANGAEAVEGYPVPPDSTSYRFMGLPEVFLRAGFLEVTPPKQKRKVFRYLSS